MHQTSSTEKKELWLWSTAGTTRFDRFYVIDTITKHYHGTVTHVLPDKRPQRRPQKDHTLGHRHMVEMDEVIKRSILMKTKIGVLQFEFWLSLYPPYYHFFIIAAIGVIASPKKRNCLKSPAYAPCMPILVSVLMISLMTLCEFLFFKLFAIASSAVTPS